MWSELGEQIVVDTKQAYQLGVDLFSAAQQAVQKNVASVTEMTKKKAA